ncbi:hypothetical protein J6590_086500 [Homalodisca vitripennis]|nr:hypothetical protein J6590_086500 [Homalodisca vitripennis]
MESLCSCRIITCDYMCCSASTPTLLLQDYYVRLHLLFSQHTDSALAGLLRAYMCCSASTPTLLLQDYYVRLHVLFSQHTDSALAGLLRAYMCCSASTPTLLLQDYYVRLHLLFSQHTDSALQDYYVPTTPKPHIAVQPAHRLCSCRIITCDYMCCSASIPTLLLQDYYVRLHVLFSQHTDPALAGLLRATTCAVQPAHRPCSCRIITCDYMCCSASIPTLILQDYYVRLHVLFSQHTDSALEGLLRATTCAVQPAYRLCSCRVITCDYMCCSASTPTLLLQDYYVRLHVLFSQHTDSALARLLRATTCAVQPAHRLCSCRIITCDYMCCSASTPTLLLQDYYVRLHVLFSQHTDSALAGLLRATTCAVQPAHRL